MAINFPTTGLVAGVTTYTVGSRNWLWNGEGWQLSYNPIGYTGSKGDVGYNGSTGYTGSAGAYLPFGTSNDSTDVRLIALALAMTT
jgi:hypothetical protein